MADNLSDRLRQNESDRRTRTERELEALESQEQGQAPPAQQQEAPPPAPRERVGVGRDLVNETTRVILRGLDGRIKALADSGANPQLLAELQARRKLILEEAERARQ